MARSFNELRRNMSPERQQQNQAKADAILRTLPLHELRAARQLSQEQLADTLNVGQAAISKMEIDQFRQIDGPGSDPVSISTTAMPAQWLPLPAEVLSDPLLDSLCTPPFRGDRSSFFLTSS